MSKYRKLILDAVNSSCGHPTAEEIYRSVRQKEPGIVMATVYNNLNSLAEAGQIRRLKTGEGSDSYDRVAVPHEHLVCDCCGTLEDILVPEFVAELEERLGCGIRSVEIHYICKACRGKETHG